MILEQLVVSIIVVVPVGIGAVLFLNSCCSFGHNYYSIIEWLTFL